MGLRKWNGWQLSMRMRAQIAERDAEVVALRAELAGVIEGHKAATELTEKIDLPKTG